MRRKRIRYFSTFPTGTSGAAILLLRVALSISAFIEGYIYLSTRVDTGYWSCIIGLVHLISGAALLIGFLSSVFSILIFLGSLFLTISFFSVSNDSLSALQVSAIYTGTIAISVFLSGPGVFSLDAQLFGRREIIIPDDSAGPDV